MDTLIEALGPILAKLPTEIALIILVGLMIWRSRAEKTPQAPDTFREDMRVRVGDLERRADRAEADSERRLTRIEADIDRLFDER